MNPALNVNITAETLQHVHSVAVFTTGVKSIHIHYSGRSIDTMV